MEPTPASHGEPNQTPDSPVLASSSGLLALASDGVRLIGRPPDESAVCGALGCREDADLVVDAPQYGRRTLCLEDALGLVEGLSERTGEFCRNGRRHDRRGGRLDLSTARRGSASGPDEGARARPSRTSGASGAERPSGARTTMEPQRRLSVRSIGQLHTVRSLSAVFDAHRLNTGGRRAETSI